MESLSLCPLVIQYLQPNFLLHFHEIQYGSSAQKFLSKHEYCAYWLSDSHTLHHGINQVLPILPMFCDLFGLNLV